MNIMCSLCNENALECKCNEISFLQNRSVLASKVLKIPPRTVRRSDLIMEENQEASSDKCSFHNEHNTVQNQGYNVSISDQVIKRVEDLGRLRNKIEDVLDDYVFDIVDEQEEEFIKKHPKEKEIIELFHYVKRLKEKLLDCWAIAANNED